MAEKRYKITTAVSSSPAYAAQGNEYKFQTGFEVDMSGTTVLCQPSQCPVITCTTSDVMGTTNGWAQQCMENNNIPGGISQNGTPYFGTPGAAVFEETTDPVTIDLDALFGG
jgi:hypothetical protein